MINSPQESSNSRNPSEADGLAHSELPGIRSLGLDLLQVSRTQQMMSLSRPALAFASYWVLAVHGWWIPAALSLVVLQFLTYTSTSHDYVHRTLGLPKWLNEWLLSVTEGICLRSGHAFRLTHLHHHRAFPESSDIEAKGATGSFWRALLQGPGNQIRLFIWAWRRANSLERRWMSAEAIFVSLWWLASGVFYHSAPAIAVYVVLLTLGGWLYPLATVWWPHRASASHTYQQTVAVRGRCIPALLLNHTYHLEHHLYPMVSSHHWRELAHRLDPHFRALGIRPLKLP